MGCARGTPSWTAGTERVVSRLRSAGRASKRRRDMISRAARRMLAAGVSALALGAGSAFAQQPADMQPTRASTLVEAQTAKAAALQPYEGDRAEQIFEKWEGRLLGLG